MEASNAFNHDHSHDRRTLPRNSGLAVLGRSIKCLGRFKRRKLQNDQALGLPVAFKHFGLAAAHTDLGAMCLYGCAGPFFVFLVLHRVGDGHVGDDVPAHWKLFSRKPFFLVTRSSSSSVSSRAFMCLSGTALGPSLMALAGSG